MTDQLRAAAQAILDRWDSPKWEWATQGPTADLMAELRAALAQQAWVCPESPEHRYAKPGHCEDCGRTLVRAQQAEQEPCSTDPRAPHGFDRTASHTAGRYVCECEHWQAEPVQEPVAWMQVLADGYKCVTGNPIPDWTPLYTAPPRQKPLTQEEIPALAEKAWKPSVYYDAAALLGTDGLVALVRAVEQAHGIKERP